VNATARRARATIRQRTGAQRATTKARRLAATGKPQPARILLVAAGLDDTTAHRFASSFSRGVIPTATAKTRVKLRGRRARWYPVKLYDRTTFAARLAAYRPKTQYAAEKFAALAA